MSSTSSLLFFLFHIPISLLFLLFHIPFSLLFSSFSFTSIFPSRLFLLFHIPFSLLISFSSFTSLPPFSTLSHPFLPSLPPLSHPLSPFSFSSFTSLSPCPSLIFLLFHIPSSLLVSFSSFTSLPPFSSFSSLTSLPPSCVESASRSVLNRLTPQLQVSLQHRADFFNMLPTPVPWLFGSVERDVAGNGNVSSGSFLLVHLCALGVGLGQGVDSVGPSP